MSLSDWKATVISSVFTSNLERVARLFIILVQISGLPPPPLPPHRHSADFSRQRPRLSLQKARRKPQRQPYQKITKCHAIEIGIYRVQQPIQAWGNYEFAMDSRVISARVDRALNNARRVPTHPCCQARGGANNGVVRRITRSLRTLKVASLLLQMDGKLVVLISFRPESDNDLEVGLQSAIFFHIILTSVSKLHSTKTSYCKTPCFALHPVCGSL